MSQSNSFDYLGMQIVIVEISRPSDPQLDMATLAANIREKPGIHAIL